MKIVLADNTKTGQSVQEMRGSDSKGPISQSLSFIKL